MTTRVLMSPPDYLDACHKFDSGIVGNTSTYNPDVAQAQWNLFVKLLQNLLGIQVDLIDSCKEAPRLPYCGYLALIAKKYYLKSSTTTIQLSNEINNISNYLSQAFKLTEIIHPFTEFYGQGTGLYAARDNAILFSHRVSLSAEKNLYSAFYTQLLQEYSMRSEEFTIKDDRFHLLDRCLNVMDSNNSLIFDQSFSEQSLTTLKQFSDNGIYVSLKEALKNVCNVFICGNKALIPKECVQTAALLDHIGYRVYQVDLSEFSNMGLSISALCLRID